MVQRSRFDVLVIGFSCVDIVFSGLPHWPTLGHELYARDIAVGVGSIFNTAATLSRLGMQVGLLTELGNDFFSRYTLDEIDRAGITREFITQHPFPMRAVSICLAHEGERGFVSYADSAAGHVLHMLDALSPDLNPQGEKAAALLAEHVRATLDRHDFDAIFLYAQPNLHPLLDLLTGRNLPIFFDVGWDTEQLANRQIFEVLKRGHVVMPNRLEAMYMTGTNTAEDALSALKEIIPSVIVKVGVDGVIAWHEGCYWTCPALPVEKVVDTTGAGDAFNGGFMYGMLKGYSFADALRCGTICGSLSTTALTGTAAVPTATQLEHLRAQPFA